MFTWCSRRKLRSKSLKINLIVKLERIEGILYKCKHFTYLASLILTCCNILSWRRILKRGFSYLDLVSFTRGRSFEEGSFLSFKPQHEASTWSEPSHAFKRSGESKEDVEKRHLCKLWWRFSFLGFQAFSHGVSSIGEDEV